MVRVAFGGPSMLSFGSMGGLGWSGLLRRFGPGFLAIMRMGIPVGCGWALEAGDDAALESARAVREIEVDGYRPDWRFKAKGAPKDLKVFAAKLET